MPGSRRGRTVYWIFTSLFCLLMSFTVYAQLCLPQVTQVFRHLGFPDYFRIEVNLAKLAGVLVLILPMAPPRLKEWAYAGFTIVLVSAVAAHLAVGDGPEAWGWSAGYLVLGALSYVSFRRMTAPA
jgi:hypothetical protein